MRIKIKIFPAIIAAIILSFCSCKKYLDKKPQQSLVVPKTLADLQAVLDNNNLINFQGTPGLSVALDDDYYVTTANWEALPLDERLNYIWDKDASYLNSWKTPYIQPIYYANLALDILPEIVSKSANEQLRWNEVKGTALFYRSFAFLQLAQLYCRPYSSSAAADLGLVLKLTANINEPLTRSTVQQTYDQITGDLKLAADLLPKTVPTNMRPNKAAAYGALARAYLSMSDYANAGLYADLSLKENSTLMDYNTAVFPFEQSNNEILYYSFPQLLNITFPPTALIDTTLYNSYSPNDLRKTLFFADNGDGTFSFNGSYSGIAPFVPFDGITVDEMYLIRAECFARSGDTQKAMDDLNKLLEKRWVSGTFQALTATDANDAKNKILIERRKELVFRGLRWSDIRRFNLAGANITLKRNVENKEYMLLPNDLRSTILIPLEIMNMGSYQQNPR